MPAVNLNQGYMSLSMRGNATLNLSFHSCKDKVAEKDLQNLSYLAPRLVI